MAILATVSILLLTFLIWPHWFVNWANTLGKFKATWWDASIWPIGLSSWALVVFFSNEAGNVRKARMYAAASLLGSPYFALYHCSTLLTLSETVVFPILSWLIVILGSLVFKNWMKLGWVLPFVLLLKDVAVILKIPDQMQDLVLIKLHKYTNHWKKATNFPEHE